jgi:hypothetical protein
MFTLARAHPTSQPVGSSDERLTGGDDMPIIGNVVFNCDVDARTGDPIMVGRRRIGEPRTPTRKRFGIGVVFPIEFCEDVIDEFGRDGLVSVVESMARVIVAQLSVDEPAEIWRTKPGEDIQLLRPAKPVLPLETVEERGVGDAVYAVLDRDACFTYSDTCRNGPSVKLMIVADNDGPRAVAVESHDVAKAS